MAKFLQGNELNSELEKIFEEAEAKIILVSPYIKLHDRYASTLLTKKDSPNIELIIVFGKNEEDFSRSMKEQDFHFFKAFPNIEIRYEKRLHAKYYANESSSILTSMNLYSYSQDNNIEAGVMTKTASFLGGLMNNVTGEENFDQTAWNYFIRVIEQSELLFKKIPEYESKMLGFSKKYKSSKIEVDKLTDFFNGKIKHDKPSFTNEIKASLEKEVIINNNLAEKKFLSTTALSKEIGLSSKDLFSKFEKLNWIERKNDNWALTDFGKNKGAQIKKGQYGEYIAWPESLINEITKT